RLTMTINGVKDLADNATSGLARDFYGAIKAPGDVDNVDTEGAQVDQDVFATVRGIVTATEFQTQNITIGGVSTPDGIDVRNNAGPFAGVARGDKIIVCGVIAQYRGMAQIQGTPVYYLVEESGLAEPAPQVVGITVITNEDEEGVNAFSGEPYEGNIVTIGPVNIGAYLANSRTEPGTSPTPGLFVGNANYIVTMGGRTGIIRVLADTNIVGRHIPTEATLRGIVTQYDNATPFSGAYSLYLRDWDDFTLPTSVQFSWNLYE
ncbi:MAG TPA: hypothetical protein PLB62_09180, partial [Candidatus Sumerlaeota bacterium]|nr:hypothetical protein [Candidatus Sumerlaeota bacterium]